MAQKLVVVGNGMAGVRAIEEILLRSGPQTGSETFDITVFGDEPYGNYNRILLSNVLAGSDDTAEIYLNPIDWYTDNDVDLLYVEKTLVDISYKIRVCLIVEADEFHGTAEKSAVLVNILSPDFVGESGCFAIRCQSARERQTISNLERQ